MPLFCPQSLLTDAAAARAAAESTDGRSVQLESLLKASLHLWSAVATQLQHFEVTMSAQMDALAAQVKASADREAAAATLLAQQRQQIDQLKAANSDLTTQLQAAQADTQAAPDLTAQLKAADDALASVLTAVGDGTVSTPASF